MNRSTRAAAANAARLDTLSLIKESA